MTSLKTYDLFISHAWRYNDEYYRLAALLDAAPRFVYRNYSVPEHDPLGTKTNAELRAALDRQIRPVNCFLAIAGMYVLHREWIQYEIEVAQRYRKPIIGVRPLGAERTPAEIVAAANEMVNWSTVSVVDAIRRLSL